MYLRFITEYIHEDGDKATGVFQCLGHLIRSKETFDYDMDRLKLIRSWFNEHLDRPTKFNKGLNKKRNNVALSWFKSSAKEHIGKMYDLIPIFENYDLKIFIIKQERIGRIIFEDKYQAVAIPFNKEKSKVE